MTDRAALRGLYAIADSDVLGERLVNAAAQALAGGARLLQYRDKSGDARRRLRDAGELRELCRQHGALLIINDDVRLAVAVAADGVHVGRDDTSLADARAVLGARAIIGVSCYNSLSRAQDAAQQGADYVAFGSVYASATKPGAVRAPHNLLRDARELNTAVCAIGGITPDNAPALIEHGAQLLAVIGGLFAVDDVEAAARRFAALFAQDASQ